MRKKTILFLILLSLVLVTIMSCSNETTKPDPDPSISIIFPNGGDSLGLGVAYKIIWTDDIDENIDIEIFKGHDSNAVRVLNYSDIPSTGEFEILVPLDMDIESDYKIKLKSVLDTTIYDISDTYFGFSASIPDGDNELSGAVEIMVPHSSGYAIYPSGDVDWFKVFLNSGQKYIFENSSADDFDTEFYLYKGNSEGTEIIEMITSDDDSGSGLQPYIEYTAVEDGYCFLRVALYSNDPSKAAKSETGYYTLNVTESISLLSPNGGEVWMRDSVQVITWDPDIGGNIVLDLIEDSLAVLNIGTFDGSEGSYNWNIPEGVSSGYKYKIRISRNEDPDGPKDESDEVFAIADNIAVTVTGEWDVTGTWGKWDGIWTFSDDGTWINSWGTSGTWELSGNIIKWYYDTGTYYLGSVEGNVMNGIMNGGSGLYGTWTAQKRTETR